MCHNLCLLHFCSGWIGLYQHQFSAFGVDEDTTRTCFNIVILEDDAFENLETFCVYLSFSSDGELLPGATEATVTIVDSDHK